MEAEGFYITENIWHKYLNHVIGLAVPRFSQWRIISVSTWVASAVDRFLTSRSAASARTQTLAGSNIRILLLAFCNLDVDYWEKSVFLHRQSWCKILIQHYPTGGFHLLIDCFVFTTAKTTLRCWNFSFITKCYLTSTCKLAFILDYSCFIPALMSPQCSVRVSIKSNDVLPYVSNIL